MLARRPSINLVGSRLSQSRRPSRFLAAHSTTQEHNLVLAKSSPSDETPPCTPSWHGLSLSSILIAATLSTSHPCSAEEIYAAGPGEYSNPVAERLADEEAKRFDDNLTTSQLRDLTSLLIDKNGGSESELESARLKVGFKRSQDGRVFLRGKEPGHWFAIKVDAQAPGYVLARDSRTGVVSIMPPDDSGHLMQIDLSDDLVVGQLFGSGAWEDVLENLSAENEEGEVVPLVLEEGDFRNTLSLLEGAAGGEEEAFE